jgi:hypothetical protein
VTSNPVTPTPYPPAPVTIFENISGNLVVATLVGLNFSFDAVSSATIERIDVSADSADTTSPVPPPPDDATCVIYAQFDIDGTRRNAVYGGQIRADGSPAQFPFLHVAVSGSDSVFLSFTWVYNRL